MHKMTTAVISDESWKKIKLKNKNKYKDEIWFLVSMPPCTALVWSDILNINTVMTSGVYLAPVNT